MLKKYTSLKNYIAFLRRQPRHMQHIYAVIFAGSMTALLGAIILYVDYDFWHEKYSREETRTEIATSTVEPKSPSELISQFIIEAKEQLKNINTRGGDLLEGKETYIKEGN